MFCRLTSDKSIINHQLDNEILLLLVVLGVCAFFSQPILSIRKCPRITSNFKAIKDFLGHGERNLDVANLTVAPSMHPFRRRWKNRSTEQKVEKRAPPSSAVPLPGSLESWAKRSRNENKVCHGYLFWGLEWVGNRPRQLRLVLCSRVRENVLPISAAESPVEANQSWRSFLVGPSVFTAQERYLVFFVWEREVSCWC